MLRPRIIPCLLIHKGGLVKTVKFSSPKYVGDPINAVRIFNEKESDELMVIDIDATTDSKEPNYNLIEKLASECRMPLCYGGGVNSAEQASRIINLGVEKVAISSAAVNDPSLLTRVSKSIGRQSVVGVIDIRIKKSIFTSKYVVSTKNNKVVHDIDPIELAKTFIDSGAGEIVFNFVDRDGTMEGYDADYISEAKPSIQVPFTVLGGASSLKDMSELVHRNGLLGLAAGSIFVFKGKFKAVLISYPSQDEKESFFRI